MSNIAEMLTGVNGVLVKSPASLRVMIVGVVLLMAARTMLLLRRERTPERDRSRSASSQV